MKRLLAAAALLALVAAGCAMHPIKRVRLGPPDLASVFVLGVGDQHVCICTRDGRYFKQNAAESMIKQIARLNNSIGKPFDVWLANGLMIGMERSGKPLQDWSIPPIDKVTCLPFMESAPEGQFRLLTPSLIEEEMSQPKVAPRLLSRESDRDELIKVCAQVELVVEGCPFAEDICLMLETIQDNCPD